MEFPNRDFIYLRDFASGLVYNYDEIEKQPLLVLKQ